MYSPSFSRYTVMKGSPMPSVPVEDARMVLRSPRSVSSDTSVPAFTVVDPGGRENGSSVWGGRGGGGHRGRGSERGAGRASALGSLQLPDTQAGVKYSDFTEYTSQGLS